MEKNVEVDVEEVVWNSSGSFFEEVESRLGRE